MINEKWLANLNQDHVNILSNIKVKVLVLACYMAMYIGPKIMMRGEPRIVIKDMCWACNSISFKHLHYGVCSQGFLEPHQTTYYHSNIVVLVRKVTE